MEIIPDIISSRQNSIVKWVASLSDKKGRSESRSFIAEGYKLCFEAAESNMPVTHIFLSESCDDKVASKIKRAYDRDIYKKTKLIVLSSEAFEKISTEKAPQGVLIVIKYLDFFSELDIIYKEDFFLSENEKAVSLYSVRDPGNLGAIIRSAVAFGFEHVIMSSDCADIYNSKTVRSAMGSVFKIKATVVKDFSSFVNSAKLNGRRVLAAELSDDAVALSDCRLNKSDIIVIGNEGHGISDEISRSCSESVFIPISDSIESLNASVAASILLWEQSKTL